MIDKTTLLIALTAACALITPALADVVTLKDGRTLEGSVRRDGDFVIVKQRFGESRVHADEVQRIDETPDLYDQLESQRANLSGGTAAERYQFATWCSQNGFDQEANPAYLGVLQVDINHPGARAALGYVQHEGRWVTLADRNRALGLVEFRGEWMTPQEKAEAMREVREAREARRAEREAEQLARRAEREAEKEAEREARRARIAAYQQELARARAREQAAREAYQDTYGYRGWGWGAAPFYRYRVLGNGYVPGAIIQPFGGYSSYYHRRRYYGSGTRVSGHINGGNWGLRWSWGGGAGWGGRR